MTTMLEQQQVDSTAAGGAGSLLDRFGGTGRVEELVDRLVDRIRSDRELAASLASVELAAFKTSLVAFFTEALIGHSRDASPDPRPPHVQLEAAQFVRVLLSLHDTLSSLGLSDELHEEVVLAVISRALAPQGE